MQSVIMRFLVALLRFLWPFCTQGTREIIGTVAVVLGALSAIVLSLYAPDEIPPVDLPAIEAPAPSLDVIEPTDAEEPPTILGMASQVGLAALSIALPVGCSGAQQQVWSDGGTRLGQCLAGCGLEAGQVAVHEWSGGEGVDLEAVGWGALPCVVSCAAQFGGFVASGLPAATARDSVGATMAPVTRSLASVSDLTPLEAMCGRPEDGPPQCHLIIPAPAR